MKARKPLSVLATLCIVLFSLFWSLQTVRWINAYLLWAVQIVVFFGAIFSTKQLLTESGGIYRAMHGFICGLFAGAFSPLISAMLLGRDEFYRQLISAMEFNYGFFGYVMFSAFISLFWLLGSAIALVLMDGPADQPGSQTGKSN